MSSNCFSYAFCSINYDFNGLHGEPATNDTRVKFLELPKSDPKLDLKRKSPRRLFEVQLATENEITSITLPVVVTVQIPN